MAKSLETAAQRFQFEQANHFQRIQVEVRKWFGLAIHQFILQEDLSLKAKLVFIRRAQVQPDKAYLDLIPITFLEEYHVDRLVHFLQHQPVHEYKTEFSDWFKTKILTCSPDTLSSIYSGASLHTAESGTVQMLVTNKDISVWDVLDDSFIHSHKQTVMISPLGNILVSGIIDATIEQFITEHYVDDTILGHSIEL